MAARTALALALLITLTACGGAADPGTGHPTQRESTSAGPAGGPLDAPAPVTPVARLLDWKDAQVPADTRVVRGTDWRAELDPASTVVDLVHDGASTTIAAGAGRVISEVLLDDDWAVVVKQDKAESAPSRAVAIDLVTGEQQDVVTPEPASGGSWAMFGGDLYYPTYGDDRAYCLASNALADANGEDGWCAARRTGWSGLTASGAGVAMMTFDDSSPVACRTVNLLDGSGLPQPLEGPSKCLAWDVAATPDGFVWSEVPKPRRQEEARLFASADGTYFDLGPGTTGSVVPCGGSIFFVRDPQSADEPARLMRWTPQRTLEIVYESPSLGDAFLGEPVCGGDVVTLASFGTDRDEHVWASVS